MKMTVVLAAALCAEAAWARERTDLFNGRDLSGWTAVADQDVTGDYAASEPTWYATNGTIRTTGTPFGYLRTKRGDFADGRLHVEYRWWRETEKPNSGVFVRLSAERGTFIPTTVENQLCRGMAGDVLGLAASMAAFSSRARASASPASSRRTPTTPPSPYRASRRPRARGRTSRSRSANGMSWRSSSRAIRSSTASTASNSIA